MKKIILIGFLVLGAIIAYGDISGSDSEEKMMPGAMFARNKKTKLKMFLPLKKTDVKLWVSAGMVHAEVSQVFKNTSQVPLEAIYVFPLPAKCTVTDMVLKTDDRIIKSVVKEKAEAKKTYEKAKREGKKTALIEEERPNIFTTSVANFLPGETVEVRISYIEPIEYSKGTYEVNFPMVVGPRYIPFKIEVDDNGDVDMVSAVPDAEKITPPLLHPSIDSGHRLTMNVEIEGIPLKEIISNTHSIKVEEEDAEDIKTYHVTLREKETVPDSDFNLKLHLAENDQPQMSYLNSVKDDYTFSMINIFPPITAEDKKVKNEENNTPREVIFLIDTSGSMSGESIGQAKAGLKKCMEMLREKDAFTIVRFSNEFSSFSPDLRKAKKETMDAAAGYIDGLTADGGTEMQQALKHVLELPAVNKENMQFIVFLTDGDVGNEESLIRLISNKLGKRRLFTFGIGSAPNEFLMRKMAEKGRAQSRFIHSHEDVGVVMSDFFKTLEAPVLTDISLTWLNKDGEKAEGITAFPSPCPDVFNERPLQVFVNYPSKAISKMVITGKISGKEKKYDYDIKDQKQSYPAIEKLYAQSEINQLMYKMIMDSSDTEDLQKEVIEIAIKHQLVTKYTSRVAVEEKIEKKPDGSLVTVNVPVELPKGWNSSKFFATSTNHPLLLLIGFIALLIAGILQFLKKRTWQARPSS